MFLYNLRNEDPNRSSAWDWENRIHPNYTINNSGTIPNNIEISVRLQNNDNASQKNKKLLEQ